MKKAFDQTVRELKREVNKKVLKVPGVEQKILDATSNETWGPHGSLLADIAQATRNFHEYQIVMHVIWKRLNDTGRNWRHVYKALIVLEYLIGHGSERVIDDIREHAYQISTLSDFQYIDSSGKDQGNNVRRKSQTLVSLVNDKEKIHEIRQKALANKDKYRPTFSTSGSSRPGSFSSASGYGDRYDDDRYGSRDDDQNGFGRGRDSGYRDDDSYARGGDLNRDGDEYGRGLDEHSGRGSNKNDDSRSGRGTDDYQFSSRKKSFDKDRDHSFEEDDGSSYRNDGGRANDASPDNRNFETKFSEQTARAPPSYESVIKKDIVQDEREVGVGSAAIPKALSIAAPITSSSQNNHGEQLIFTGVQSSTMSTNDTSFDEFDPRGFTPALNFVPPAASSAPSTTSSLDVDLFDSSSLLDPVNSLALVLTSSSIPTYETEGATTNSDFGGAHFLALSSSSAKLSQSTEDPFGDGPFKATPQENFSIQRQSSLPIPSTIGFFPPSANSVSIAEPIAPVNTVATSLDFGFGESLGGLTYYIPSSTVQLHSANPMLTTTSELTLPPPNIDVMSARPGPQNFQAANTSYGHSSFLLPGFDTVSLPAAQPFVSTNSQVDQKSFHPQPQYRPSNPQVASHMPKQPAQMVPVSMLAAHVNPTQQPTLSSVNQRSSATISGPSNAKPLNDTFETKSSVWADTLNRGLVNLNISGSKTNPLADIGVDFDSINRLERRKEMERGPSNPLTSTIAMGKAMGSGSGFGRAGTGHINPTARPTIGSGMGMAAGMPMGNSAAGMAMGIGGNHSGTMNPSMGGGMGMHMGMGMVQGGPMRPQPEMQSTPPNFSGSGYNSMMGTGGYGSDRWRSQ